MRIRSLKVFLPLLSVAFCVQVSSSISFEPIGEKTGRLNASQEDYQSILSNVSGIAMEGIPGFLCVFGESAIPLLGGQTGQANVYHPIAAANNLGRGKIIGFTHDAFLTPESPPVSGRNQLILNSVNWTSSSGNSTPRVVVIKNQNDPLTDFLFSHDIPADRLTVAQLENSSSSELLQQYDVILVKEFFDDAKLPKILLEYTQNGGGLVMALTSWAASFFLEVNGPFGQNFAPNMVSAAAGFVWRNEDGDCYAYATSIDKSQFNSSQVYVQNTHVQEAWLEIAEFLRTGSISDQLDRNKLQYSSIIEAGFEFMPPEYSFITGEVYEHLRNYTSDTSRQPVASGENPVVNDTQKFDLQLFYALTLALKPEHVSVHPGSLVFPGSINSSYSYSNIDEVHQVQVKISPKPSWLVENKVPGLFDQNSHSLPRNPWKSFMTNQENTCDGNEEADQKKSRINMERKRIFNSVKEGGEDELSFSTRLPLWYSTGLYAPAGQVINISVIEPVETLKKYQILIGSHTDDTSRHDKWLRSPRIAMRAPLENNRAELASPYGGIIYIVVPEAEVIKNDSTTIALKVTGGVKYPLFRLGETAVKEWRETIRHAPGPWAEFESDNLVLTVQSSSAKQVDDPENLILFWDQVMDAIADLSQIPRTRFRQERMVGDILISAGFMHSGYPIMTFLKESDLSIDTQTLRKNGTWGHFHELGHNHQSGHWTFSGTGEVTCNLFALYVLNTVCGIATEDTRAEMTPAVYKPSVSQYIVNGVKFSEWQNQPFLALLTYVQLQRQYGWGSFKLAFRQYHSLTPEQQPSNDAEKIDLWVVTFSKVVGEDLTPFFTSWGLPVSQEAASQINQLPEAAIRIFDLLND